MPPKRRGPKRTKKIKLTYGFHPQLGYGYFGHHPQHGFGIFDSIGNWIKGAANTVYEKALKPAAGWVKDNHIISSALGMIPHPAGKAAAMAAKLAGLGKRRRAASNMMAIRV